MPTFNGAMLRLARQYRGLSQTDLADRINVDSAIISRAENGISEPSLAVIARCAETLSVRPNLFDRAFQPAGIPVSFHAMWRKKQSVAQREIERVLADANFRAWHLRMLMPSIVFEPELPIPSYEPGEYDRSAADIARLVRRAWNIPSGPLPNLTSLVESAGVFVFHADLEKIDVDGLTLRLAGLPPIIVLNKHMPADRMRFTLAHELGHIVMHVYPSEDMETEANQFAREFLAPSNDLRPYFAGQRVDLRTLARLKMEWRISMNSLLYAANDLGFLTARQKTSMWAMFNKLGYKKREPAELDFEHEPTRSDKDLLNAHVQSLGYSWDELAEMLGFPVDDVLEMYGLPKPRHGLRLVS
jgi:Zn-dependent peptidase ImmA (M78 family)/transcriptional regulator with XRE-family HTH domain